MARGARAPGRLFVTAGGFALIALGACLASGILTAAVLRLVGTRWLLDHPNERSLHDRPVPRGGGLAIVAALAGGGALVAVAWPHGHPLAVVGAGAGAIAAVSFADDVVDVPPGVRIAVHLAAALVVTVGGLGLDRLSLPGVDWGTGVLAGGVLTALFVVWLVNLYNFMDGMDGFAGGMAVLGFGAYAILSAGQGAPAFTATAAIAAGASLGFLAFNFPPARIFMGDVGSSVLGFVAAALALWAQVDGLFPLWASILVFSPFVVDATVTLARRVLRGERVWLAHRTHHYQRLVRLGWGHRRTVLWEYALMTACAASAIVAVRLDAAAQWAVLGAWALAYTSLMIFVARLERRGEHRCA